MSKWIVVVALCAVACSLNATFGGDAREGRTPPMEELPGREPVENPAPPAPPSPPAPPQAEADNASGEIILGDVLDNDEPFFTVPRRAAYRNLFERTASVDDVGYVPGASDLIVDVTTVLNGSLHLSLMSFAVVNRNATSVTFDAKMSFYADVDGAPDVSNPIGRVSMPGLRCPPRSAIGVAKLYLGGHSSFELPSGRVWFGVRIGAIEGGDPARFGQVEMDNVTVGNSEGVVFDASASPPAVVLGAHNLDRMIIPFVSCEADWQMDGAVDVRDFTAFVGDYVTRPEEADYTGDGVTNIHDYVHFCVAYMDCSRR